MALTFPTGEIITRMVSLSDFSPSRILALMREKFSGYVVVTLEGVTGIEEGVLFLLDGRVCGALYSLDSQDIVSFGEKGLRQFGNGMAAPHGVVDVCRLSRQQVELILALDDKLGVSEPKNGLGSVFSKSYDPSLVTASLPEAERENERQKVELLKKMGLGELFK